MHRINAASKKSMRSPVDGDARARRPLRLQLQPCEARTQLRAREQPVAPAVEGVVQVMHAEAPHGELAPQPP